jgi:zinc protease
VVSFPRMALFAAAIGLCGAPAVSQQAGPPPPAARPWLYAGSDIPVDSAWRFGALANGLRYAIRRNFYPSHSVSIRVRIDAGALMERDDELGYAHFMEHMAFRGTASVPDGEGIRIWQRLGANFGTDTNAFTDDTQTVYAIDLPKADPDSIDTGIRIVSDMIEHARIDPAAVEIERKVVVAERDLRLPPLQRRIRDASRAVVLTGTRATKADVTGTDATLNAATAQRLRAFYERWYRPERVTVAIVGDADPAALEAEIVKYFGPWTGKGPLPQEPDYGQPAIPAKKSALIVDPQSVSSLSLYWPSQHDDRPWTQARQQVADIRSVAVRILSRRFVRKVRDGASFTSGGAGFSETRHVLDTAAIAVQPKLGLWRQSLDESYGLLADAAAAPPGQDEIDREVAVIDDSFRAEIAAMPTARSSSLADLIVHAVDSGDVVADPSTYAHLFDVLKPRLTPANVGATMRTMFAGEPRALLTSPQPVAGAETALASALVAARTVKAAARARQKPVGLADLGAPGTPGRIVSRTTIADLGITRVRFANGVELDVKPTDFEKDRVLVAVTVGNGVAALDPARLSPTWTSGAIAQSGIGPWDADGLERALAGHRISLGFGASDQAFIWTGATNRAELGDQLRVLATAVREPHFDPAVLARQRGAIVDNYDSLYATPAGVFSAFAGQAIHRGDFRYAQPSREQVASVGPDQFRAFWQPLFASGPRKLVIAGDVDLEAAIRAALATFGAAPTRPSPSPAPDRLAVLPPRAGTPDLLLEHRGDSGQMLVATIWSTTGSLADIAETRALNVAASIIGSRLYDRFREAEGGTYTPAVSSGQSSFFPSYGIFVAYSQIRAERLADFTRATREIAADLVKSGPTADELNRAVAPIVSGNERARRTNAYWYSLMANNLDDPRILDAARTGIIGYQALTAADVEKAAAHWLSAPPSLTVLVKGRPARAAPAATP